MKIIAYIRSVLVFVATLRNVVLIVDIQNIQLQNYTKLKDTHLHIFFRPMTLWEIAYVLNAVNYELDLKQASLNQVHPTCFKTAIRL